MKHPTLISLALLCLIAAPAASQHVIEQATFPPGCGCQPSLAVSLDHYTAIAYVTEQPGYPEPQVAVQLVPTNPDTDEIWPEPTHFGPGAKHAICWSRHGFTLAFVREDTVWAYQSDHNGNWNLDEPHAFVPGGEVLGLDLWGVPTDAAGHSVYLTIDDDVDPSYGLDCRIQFTSYSIYTGWSILTMPVSNLDQLPASQVSWTYGPAGPWPAIYFLAVGGDGLELFRTYRDEMVWTAPVRIPGDGLNGPTAFEAEFDVARSTSIGVVGLGPQPTCPCGTIHFLACDVYGDWQPEQNITVPYAYFDWPHSPRIDMGWDDVMHIFWYQLDTDNQMHAHRERLEYRTYDDGVMTDAGGMFESMPFRRGIGSRVDVGVTPDGARSVLAWSKTDTIDGIPQLEQIFLARSTVVSAAPDNTPHPPAVTLSAWPNPFNPRVNLEVRLPVAGPMKVDIYDTRGRHVQRVYEGTVNPGTHHLAWDGTMTGGGKAPSGVYVARVVADMETVTRKLVLAE